LENRKVIDRAKRCLMRSRGLCEAEAYTLLRRTGMNPAVGACLAAAAE
jgi:AmiR/NasT family two-component response regulator